MRSFQIKRFAELVRQLVRGPGAVRRRQAARLEELLIAFDPDRIYPYEFIHFRITGFRPKEDIRDTYAGKDLLPDLLRGLTMLSASMPRSVEELDEAIYTEAEACGKLGVSHRTLRRWRERGLAAAAYQFADGHQALGVRHKALDSFLARHPQLARRAKPFSRVSRSEETRIVAAARRHAAADGLRLTTVAGRIARELGRARETVRQALLRHDREHPDEAVFGAPAGRMTEHMRRRVHTDWLQGVSVPALCERHRCSRASIYRIINRERAAALLQEHLTCIHEEAFTAPDADVHILGEELQAALQKAEAPDASSSAAAAASAGPARQGPLLTKAEETALLRAYNYCKFRATELRRGLNPKRYVATGLIEDIAGLQARAEHIRERLIGLHLPLVEQTARQHVSGSLSLQRLLADGRAHLGRLVASFDYRGRGRFAPCARLELMKAFAQGPGRSSQPSEPPA